ncbi:hypothetical protein FXW78_45835 [Rhodococcus opacus]|nr:hypothetical protein [Rhodococcus opacus]
MPGPSAPQLFGHVLEADEDEGIVLGCTSTDPLTGRPHQHETRAMGKLEPLPAKSCSLVTASAPLGEDAGSTNSADQPVVIERLTRKHPDIPGGDVRAVVMSAHDHFRGRKIRDFVPLLVERLAHEQLTAMTDPVSRTGEPATPVSHHDGPAMSVP